MKKIILLLVFLFSILNLLSIEPVRIIHTNGGSIHKARFSPKGDVFMILQRNKATFFNTDDWKIEFEKIIPLTIVDTNQHGIYPSTDITTDGKYFLICEDSLIQYDLSKDTKVVTELTHDVYGEGSYNVHPGNVRILNDDNTAIVPWFDMGSNTFGWNNWEFAFNYSISNNNIVDGEMCAGRIDGWNSTKEYFVGYGYYSLDAREGDDYSYYCSTLFGSDGKRINSVDEEFFGKVALDNTFKIYEFYGNYLLKYDSLGNFLEYFELRSDSNYYDGQSIKDVIYIDTVRAFVIVSEDSSIKIVDNYTLNILDEYQNDTRIRHLIYMPSENEVIFADEGGSIKIFTLDYFLKTTAEFFSNKDTINQYKKVQFFPRLQRTAAYYEWDFGDGNTSYEMTPKHAYENPGHYDVQLKVRYNNQERMIRKKDFIYVEGLKIDSSSSIRLSWAKQVSDDFTENSISYSSDGKTIAHIIDDCQIFYFNIQSGNGVFSGNYCDNKMVYPSKNHDYTFVFSNDMELIDNNSGSVVLNSNYPTCSCYFIFMSSDYESNEKFFFHYTENENELLMVHDIYCYTDYDSDVVYGFFLFDIEKDSFTVRSRNDVYPFENEGYRFLAYNKYNQKLLFNKMSFIDLYSEEETKFIEDENMQNGIKQARQFEFLDSRNNMLFYRKYHNQSYLYSYNHDLDSVWVEKVFNSPSIKIRSFYNPKHVLIATESKVLYIYSLDNHSIVDSIEFLSIIDDISVSPVGYNFSVVTDEGILYNFTSSLLLDSNEERNNKQSHQVEYVIPNPAKDFIELRDVSGDVQLFNVLGVEAAVSSQDTNHIREGNKVRIDVSHLSPGIYFVCVDSKVLKFVKI